MEDVSKGQILDLVIFFFFFFGLKYTRSKSVYDVPALVDGLDLQMNDFYQSQRSHSPSRSGPMRCGST